MVSSIFQLLYFDGSVVQALFLNSVQHVKIQLFANLKKFLPSGFRATLKNVGHRACF